MYTATAIWKGLKYIIFQVSLPHLKNARTYSISFSEAIWTRRGILFKQNMFDKYKEKYRYSLLRA